MAHRLQRTLVAAEGISLTARFDGYFCHDRISGYVPRLVEPAGESTGGGKQAVQHISLQATEVMGPPLTAGWVNCASKEAKIRTLACMQAILTHRSKGRSVRLDAQAYQKFFDKCWAFLESQGLRPAAEHEPPELAGKKAASPAASAVPGWAWLVMAVLAVVVVGLVALVLSGRVGLGRG